MPYDKPILIQTISEETEEWIDYAKLHASVNKTKQSEYFNAGSTRSKRYLTFGLRYCKKLEDVINNTEMYRIVYRGRKYNIVDSDDFMERHLDVKLIGESY